LSNGALLGVVILGLIGVGFGGPLGGGGKATILLGIPRVACGFFGGVLLYRLWLTQKLPDIKANFFVLAAVIWVIFCIPTLIDGWAFLLVYCVFIFVVICAVGARQSLGQKYCKLLGEISYPLYLIHWLTLYIFTWLGTKLGLVGPKYIVVAMAHWGLAPAIAYFVARYYDAPVRQFLAEVWKSNRVEHQKAQLLSATEN
jgi:peptidoglycan/LPS O-acetylase OafA/YrhL